MPETAVAWMMFGYFAIGALGGWVVLVLILKELWKDARNK